MKKKKSLKAKLHMHMQKQQIIHAKSKSISQTHTVWKIIYIYPLGAFRNTSIKYVTLKEGGGGLRKCPQFAILDRKRGDVQ